MNIGVLDDNPAILSFLGHALSLDGHAVALHMTTSSLLEALMPAMTSDYEAVPYDLLILDLLLPAALSGIDVLREVRKHFQSWQLPVIVITALSGPTLEQYRRLLPDDVLLLQKPISLRALRTALAQMGEEADLRHSAGGPASS
jgi:Response regulators consisting of a CheY-like receiver domain and a winged-helix DNA-binding domain